MFRVSGCGGAGDYKASQRFIRVYPGVVPRFGLGVSMSLLTYSDERTSHNALGIDLHQKNSRYSQGVRT